jgi:hypothetical protein
MCKGTIRASLIVSCVALAMLATTSVIAYCAGRSIDTELRFLTPGRAPTPEEASVIYPIEYALHTTERNDVILIGDSTCRHDVDPALMGMPAYNLGVMGMTGPQVDLVTLRTYLARHPSPKAVVLCISAYAFEQGNNCPEAKGVGERFVKNYASVADAVSFSAVPLLIQRGAASVGQSATNGPDVRDLPFLDARIKGETFRTLQAKLRDARGYWRLPEPSPNAAYVPPWSGEPVVISTDWSLALRDLGALCKSCGAMLLVRVTPMRPDMRTAKDWMPAVEWLRATHGPKVCEPILTFYEPALCWDHLHLNRAGVEKFTAAVAKDVQAALRDVR